MNLQLTPRGRLAALAIGLVIVIGIAAVFVALAVGSGGGPASSAGSSNSPRAMAGVAMAASTTTTQTTAPTDDANTTSTRIAPTSTSTSARATTTTASSRRLVVVIDPGHQAKGDHSLEPNGPGSATKKDKVSDGTAGVSTRTPESELALSVSLKLRDSLRAHGITVVMTRTTQNVDISNVARAQIANKADADLFLRIHADGSTNQSINGIHTLYPVSIKGWTDDIATPSKQAATIMQRDLISATGATNRGIDPRSDQTGFNWSNVPSILVEMGFMTNAAEDRKMATAAYQQKIVAGLTQGVLQYLRVN